MSELHVFVDCLRRETEPPVSSADARASVAVAVAATRSIREGAAVEVTLESRQHAGAGREPPRSREKLLREDDVVWHVDNVRPLIERRFADG